MLVAVFAGVGVDAIGLAWQASGPAIVPVTIFSLTMAVFLGLGNGAVFKEVPVYFPRTTGAATGINCALIWVRTPASDSARYRL